MGKGSAPMRNVPVDGRFVYVVPSPNLLSLYPVEECVVVVLDVFRASTTLTAFLHFRPSLTIQIVESVEEALRRQAPPEIIACGEWKARIPDGFFCGNSPLAVQRLPAQTHTVAYFSTNGVPLLWRVRHAQDILIGSFWNLSALAEYLSERDEPVLLACSSWRGHLAIEDMMLAGALVERLNHRRIPYPDDALIALLLWETHHHRLEETIRRYGTHANRLKEQGFEEDVVVCLERDCTRVIPRFDPETNTIRQANAIQQVRS